MDVDEDDDFYDAPAATEEPKPVANVAEPEAKPQQDDDLEEGEEEEDMDEDGSDSDIDIITERKDGTKAPPPAQPRYNEIRNIPQRTTNESAAKQSVVKKETPSKNAPKTSTANLPGLAISKIDVDAKPIYEPAGKPITQVDIDEDLTENDKPWRRPGTDISDYFNYGFDEFTWALYASKQENLRGEYSQDKIAQNNKKMFEDMNMMMAMGGMPGMPGMPADTTGGAMPGMPAEMQAMMQQMMASGMDPSQMDPAAMFAGMQGTSGAGAGGAQAGNQGQGFGGQGFGQGQGQMGYGFDQGMNGNRGGFGRGRGRGRNW
ncbi:hypothetical protein BP5796_05235 [Coleophoma crateriformis]|uniref:Pre-mRNA polyadenylation factor Fip1 domain-containing protein n=1 Tax=Coleophoma crateriformis TaxID=565419 RepID=A0A3D8S2K6_9HELO|nr:hypothetical protein BP5796_05235 [Coleophoma crateriformis]